MYKFCNNWSFSSAGQDMFSSYASSGTSAIRYGTSGTMSGLSQPTMSNTRRTSPIHPGSWSSGYRPSQVIYLLVFIMWHSDVWIDWLKCHHLSPLLISLSNFSRAPQITQEVAHLPRLTVKWALQPPVLLVCTMTKGKPICWGVLVMNYLNTIFDCITAFV